MSFGSGTAALCNAPSALVGLAMSRPLLENGVRRRLLRLPNVCLRQGSEVEEPVFDRDQGRVAGVRVRSRDGADGVEALTADLVVDATGRGSRCIRPTISVLRFEDHGLNQ